MYICIHTYIKKEDTGYDGQVVGMASTNLIRGKGLLHGNLLLIYSWRQEEPRLFHFLFHFFFPSNFLFFNFWKSQTWLMKRRVHTTGAAGAPVSCSFSIFSRPLTFHT